jgi:hypothetical protein
MREYWDRVNEKARQGDQHAIATLRKQKRTVPPLVETQSGSDDLGESSSTSRETQTPTAMLSNDEVQSHSDEQEEALAPNLEEHVPVAVNPTHLEVAKALVSDVYSLMGKSFNDTAGERDRLDQFRDRHKWMEPGTAYILDQLDYQELVCLFEEPWLSDAIAMDPCSSETST